jgi:hypothetical protein
MIASLREGPQEGTRAATFVVNRGSPTRDDLLGKDGKVIWKAPPPTYVFPPLVPPTP